MGAYDPYIVELRGLSVVVTGQSIFGREMPLENGPEGESEPLRLRVFASDPKDARARVLSALQALISDELEGDIARRDPPFDY